MSEPAPAVPCHSLNRLCFELADGNPWLALWYAVKAWQLIEERGMAEHWLEDIAA